MEQWQAQEKFLFLLNIYSQCPALSLGSVSQADYMIVQIIFTETGKSTVKKLLFQA